jgi:predicted phosphohydrolase
MSVKFWAIADTHLSFARPRDNTRFGEKWYNHEARIAEYWQERIAPRDVVFIPGDVSWAHSTARVLPDLDWLMRLPGRKVLLRGNHDHWWKNPAVARQIAEPLGFTVLDGESIELDGVIVCGAMGHIAPSDPYYVENPKKDRYRRELARLEQALCHASERRAAGQPLILLMHYPPFTSEGKPTAFVDLIGQHRPTLCLYGHLHFQKEWQVAVNRILGGVQYRLVAADYVAMKPQLVWKTAMNADGTMNTDEESR